MPAHALWQEFLTKFLFNYHYVTAFSLHTYSACQRMHFGKNFLRNSCLIITTLQLFPYIHIVHASACTLARISYEILV